MSVTSKLRQKQMGAQQELRDKTLRAAQAEGEQDILDRQAKLAALSPPRAPELPDQPKPGTASTGSATRVSRQTPKPDEIRVVHASETEPTPKPEASIKRSGGRQKSHRMGLESMLGKTSNPVDEQRIQVRIDPDTQDALVSLESEVLFATSQRLRRSAVVTEAARRVAAKPRAYEGTEVGYLLGARVPSDVYKQLVSVTNLARPSVPYGPLVGAAIAEVVADVRQELHRVIEQSTPE